jgi:hypothetical protein
VLRDLADITDSEWAAIERGEAVAKLLGTDNREVAVAGAVRIAAASESFAARFREVEHLERASVVLDVGRLSAVPRPSDLAGVTFEEHGLDLRDCRPSDCVVRLSAADIERFHREVEWSAADWRDRSAGVWRDVLATHAAAYVKSGRTALPVYANKSEPLSVASEVSGIVSDLGFVAAFAPEFLAYMRDFRPPGPAGAEHTLYWSKEDFGIRPILRITHQVMWRSAPEPPGRPVIIAATNQVYADHYLDAAVSVTFAVEASAEDHGKQFYLVSVSRARTRSLTGWTRSIVRSMVHNRTREALRKLLTSTKSRLEATSGQNVPKSGVVSSFVRDGANAQPPYTLDLRAPGSS